MKEDYKMDTTKMWDYRVVRKESDDGSDEWYSVQEVYYNDETGEPMAQTIDLMVEGDTITGMRTQLELMLKSLDETVLDEDDIVTAPKDIPLGSSDIETKGFEFPTEGKWIYESPDGGETIFRREFGNYDEREKIKSPSLKSKVLKLEMENAEMRDRLDELGELLPAQGESEDIQNTIKENMDKLRGL